MNLGAFFTTGTDEVRQWTIRNGTKAPQAAGVIHGDFEKTFIQAIVYNYNVLKEEGDEASVKAKGKVMTKGKEYVVEVRLNGTPSCETIADLYPSFVAGWRYPAHQGRCGEVVIYQCAASLACWRESSPSLAISVQAYLERKFNPVTHSCDNQP